MAHEPWSKSRAQLTRRTLICAGGAGLALGSWAASAEGFSGRSAGATLAAAERRRAELVDLLTRLVAIRSHSGESAEQAQDVVVGYLRGLSYDVETSADAPSRLADHAEYMPPNPPGDGPFVNVVGRPSAGSPAEVAVFSHIDTEIPGDGWETDPYRLAKDGPRLHGLGAADDKGGVAAMLVAASLLRELEGPLPVVMSLHGKGGGSRGSLPVFNRLQGAQSLDAVLYSHPAETGRGLVDIKHVVQGALDITMTVTGWRGAPLEIGSPDSARYEEGGDALQAYWRLIEHLRSGVLKGCSVNVGELEAGDRIGAVPDTARARIRVLFDSPWTWRELLAALRDEADSFLRTLPTSGGDYSAAIELSGLGTNPGSVEWDSEHCRALRSAVAGVTGVDPNPYRNHYGGDIRFPLRLLGVPTFGIGSVGGNFYGPNEWVDEDDLVRLVAVIVDAVRGWADVLA